jgi:catechol 2,3-dioxygenase-like lactoylglutathione lyase family enzyme
VPEITSATFVLSVNNLEDSRTYYIEKLGFTEDLSVDGWSFLSRGSCNVRLGDCPGLIPMSEVPDHSWFAYLHVVDARGLFDEFLGKGVQIWHSLEDKPWRMREFGIVTPDGHRLVFGERLA